MRDTREEVLERLRRSLRSAALPVARGVNSAGPERHSSDARPLAESFIRELEGVAAVVHRARNRPEAVARTLSLVESAGAAKILTGQGATPLLRELREALQREGIEILDAFLPAGQPERRARLYELGAAEVGLTEAFAGLADTGSIVLVSGADTPRIASLLPPHHIALITVSSLYPSMAAFFGANPEITRKGSNLVFITGPSRTADIELTLTLGVHGPRTLEVVLFDDEE